MKEVEGKAGNHEPYTTTYYSVSGLKAVLLIWDTELQAYEPWMTGPSFSNPEDSRQWAKSWAVAEGIKYVE